MLVALQNLLSELRLLGLSIIAIAKAVALLVGLSSNVESVLIAEVIPNGVIRIVSGTHGVDVETLHNLDVLNHALA